MTNELKEIEGALEDAVSKLEGDMKSELQSEALATIQELQKTHVLVPREPTEEMIGMGFAATNFTRESFQGRRENTAKVYKAMIKECENV